MLVDLGVTDSLKKKYMRNFAEMQVLDFCTKGYVV